MITALVYSPGGTERLVDATGVADLDRAADPEARAGDGTVWVRATDADAAELDRVAEAFGIHPLSVEDIQRGVRPKTEEYADYTFVLVKTARLRRGETTFDEEIRTQPVGVFVGDDWLVTLSTEAVSAVDAVWGAVEASNPRLVGRGPDFAAYRVVDRIVDGYFSVLDDIEDTIEEVEDGILARPDPDVLAALNTARRELLSMRKLLWPTREAAGTLARGDPTQVRDETEKYYRDVYDHLVQLVDLTETYRDLVAGAREIYLSALSQSTNEVMKTLTVVATIILPLSFVVGFFGMNFGASPYNMPELAWPLGYPAVVLGLATSTAILLTFFRRRRWL